MKKTLLTFALTFVMSLTFGQYTLKIHYTPSPMSNYTPYPLQWFDGFENYTGTVNIKDSLYFLIGGGNRYVELSSYYEGQTYLFRNVLIEQVDEDKYDLTFYEWKKPGDSGFSYIETAPYQQVIHLRISPSLSVENLNSSDFSIFPNPANSSFAISNTPSGANLFITDITGKLVYQSLVAGEQTVINVSDFTTGIYFVNVEHNGSRLVEKLVVGK